MRCLVISDIHANLPAFEAVLADVKKREIDYDITWCLGDLVGYGAFPNECIELLRTLPNVCLTGNHDWAVMNKLDESEFNGSAATVVQWTRACLEPHNLKYLLARPATLEQDNYLLVHASPREPIWEYVTDPSIAEDNFECFKQHVCLIGHTHVASIFVQDSRTKPVRMSLAEPGSPFAIRKDARYLLNPGSVGQPRDGDPRAAYAILDTVQRRWMPQRAEYDIAAAQQKMRDEQFPHSLIERLEYGR
jgi:diadenosine tetraphosphatase ApaH/serine/threonine PP2A family protein phosphatase